MSSAASPGRSISEAAPLLIFDLDGTILAVNSFPIWARFMLWGAIPGLALVSRAGLALKTAGLLLRRKIFGVSHERTKREFQFLWSERLSGNQKALDHLLAGMESYVRPELKPLLAAIARGEADAVMTTAAAAVYAEFLGLRLGFRHVLATRRDDAKENADEEKCSRTLGWIERQDWTARKRIFFADHADDFPLMKMCNLVVWFGSAEEMPALRAQLSQVHVAFHGELNTAQLFALAECRNL